MAQRWQYNNAFQNAPKALEKAWPLRYHRRWRGGRVVEGAPLLREYAVIPHRGFESLPLRQNFPKYFVSQSFFRLYQLSLRGHPKWCAMTFYTKFTANWTHSGHQYLHPGGTHGPPPGTPYRYISGQHRLDGVRFYGRKWLTVKSTQRTSGADLEVRGDGTMLIGILISKPKNAEIEWVIKNHRQVLPTGGLKKALRLSFLL